MDELKTSVDTGVANLIEEMAILNLRILKAVVEYRERTQSFMPEDSLGYAITDGQVDAVLSDLISGVDGRTSVAVSDIEIQIEILKRGQEINALANQDGHPDSRTSRITDAFQLSDFEQLVVCLCVAPEIDQRYGVLFGYLQDDATKRLPTLGLAMTLFPHWTGVDLDAKVFYPGISNLITQRLLATDQSNHGRSVSRLDRVLRLEERVLDYLFGSDVVEPLIQDMVSIEKPSRNPVQFIAHQGVLDAMERVSVERLSRLDRHVNVVIQVVGQQGTGKRTAARSLLQYSNNNLLLADLKKFSNSERIPRDLIALVSREAKLQSADVYWENFDVLFDNDTRHENVYQDFQDYVAPKIGTTFIASTKRWYPLNTSNDWDLLSVDIPSPAFPERLRIWQSHLGSLGIDSNVQIVSDIASKFELNGFQIQAATRSAFHESRGQWLDGEEIPARYLWEAARRHSNTRLEQVAQVVLSRHRLEDLVLPPQQKELLDEICNRFNNAHVVYDDWGFLSGSLRGRGLNILFAGPSGTGKTMSAEVMAGELGLELYKIDLSSVVSKYIGETEKNLDVVFREAEGSNAILLFDEADSIFGKRSEVKDAHDRYANLEVSYLLQKMEDYKGIAILTTNFRRNMDDAFLRRMHCSLEFPFPNEEDRYEIWQRSIPSEAPTHPDLDLRFMAKQFKFTGGSIKNVAVSAAFYAAESSLEICMEHVIRATKREFQKQGRLITESDFGSYYPLVKS
jgi:hypothetical protein